MWLKFWTWFKMLRKDLVILFFAWRNPLTPRYIKVMLVAVLGYLISPVDFVPDYIPLIGITDDLAIVPAALLYITSLLPPGIRRDCEERTRRTASRMPYILAAAGLLMAAWVAFLFWGVYTLLK